jgi:hypothetical protein
LLLIKNMDIKKLEINLFKTSEIQNGDTILVKIDEEKKSKLKKEDIKFLYDEIKKIVKKDISIYFFPKYLSIDIIKNHVKNIEDSKESILKEGDKINENN